ncbi:MAG: metallophosphoesterase [Pyrinomonadaceae bacterium]
MNPKAKFKVSCLAAVFIVAVLLFVYAFFIEPNRVLVNQYDIDVKKIPASFDGMRIVAISDVHGGSNFIDRKKIDNVVKKANAQNADLIVLLGDYVSQKFGEGGDNDDSLEMPIKEIAAALRPLKAKYGVYAILGNHDGAYSDDKVASALTDNGIRVLQNEIVNIIASNGEKLHILGLIDHLEIQDTKEFQRKIEQKLEQADISNNLIVLEHSPDIAKIFSANEKLGKPTALFLSGHSHGGQVWFPLIGSLIVPNDSKYAYGLVHEQNFEVFITTGIGTSIMPVRFMVPPEIAVVTIHSRN